MTQGRKPNRKPNSSFWLSLLLGACILLLGANLWRLSQPSRPDPRMVGLAVRATLFAVPSPTPRLVEVTRVVEIVVEVTATPQPSPTVTPTDTPTPTLTATPTGAPVSMEESKGSAQPDLFAAVAADLGGLEEMSAASLQEAQADGSSSDQAGVFETGEIALKSEPALEPELPPAPAGCPQSSGNSYTNVPVAGGGAAHPDALHADLNLSLRGYAAVDVAADLFNKDGPVDSDPPQLAGIFGDYRRPAFGQSFRVHDWNWSCGERGCRGDLVDTGAATLVTLLAGPGEALGVPHRGAQIYGGGYKALVLYAESNRITLGYTREDSVANGYAVHLEGLCVDPNLLALYQNSNAAGRGSLPALREDEILGTAGSGAILVAIRDRGVFFDPRSRLDWWHGF